MRSCQSILIICCLVTACGSSSDKPSSDQQDPVGIGGLDVSMTDFADVKTEGVDVAGVRIGMRKADAVAAPKAQRLRSH